MQCPHHGASGVESRAGENTKILLKNAVLCKEEELLDLVVYRRDTEWRAALTEFNQDVVIFVYHLLEVGLRQY